MEVVRYYIILIMVGPIKCLHTHVFIVNKDVKVNEDNEDGMHVEE